MIAVWIATSHFVLLAMTSKISSIGIIAPAASIKEGELEYLDAGIQYLESLGLKVTKANNLYDAEELCKDSDTFLPGSKAKRIDSMMQLWSDSTVDLLLSMRGGYGCVHLLEDLDYDYISKNPKPILGYSDLTALFSALYTQAYKGRLPLFHTPMLMELSRLTATEKTSFEQLLSSIDLEAYKDYALPTRKEKILGGNLSVLAGLVGTKYLYDFKDSVMFLEDCKEPAYKIERMLYQLKYSGAFNKVTKIILGESDEAVFNTGFFDELGIPYETNLAYGHKVKKSLVLG